ncbi:adenylate kinase [Anaerofilum sp. BX8]|uniref:Adenylate kinase n=1 Tax=Anaerofilum hominis TaxID=2763016 RepID=A0A923I6T6_9FIRM|nr:adenylate kinase [Anaerofilum hominis]MBC5581341.1 adenylate kinase [Anaerofilum hominis]
MNLILLGAPGAGKGTQAEIICEKFSIPAVSTGNILREAVKNGTEMGKKAKAYIDGGKLVPDDVIISIIKERLCEPDCENGFILDGVPRTVVQAEAIEKAGIRIDKVIDIEVADGDIVKRLSGRRVCASCGASYHTVYKPSSDPSKCDRCGGELIVRKDDEPATVLERLAVYHEQTEPLKDFYAARGKLAVVEGQEEVADTTALVLKALEA